MKKLLLTIFTIAAIVACDKDDMFGDDSSSINVLEQAEEINASVDIDYSSFINDLANDITKEEIAAYESSKTTARTGAAGTQWIHVVFFNFGPNSIPLAYLRSDDTTEICPEVGQTSVIYTLQTAPSGASRLLIDAIDGSGNVIPQATSNIDISLRANYATLFSQTVDRLSRAQANFSGVALGSVPLLTTLASAGIDFECDEWTGTTMPNGAIRYSNPTRDGYDYEVTPAPFPLDGFLATFLGTDTSISNFAGSPDSNDGASAVINAIENDIRN